MGTPRRGNTHASPQPAKAAPNPGTTVQGQQKAPPLRSPAVEATNQAAEGMGRDPHDASDSLDDYMILEEAFLPSGNSGGEEKLKKRNALTKKHNSGDKLFKS